jgi:hypothetical protein
MSFVLNVQDGRVPKKSHAQTKVYFIIMAWIMFNAAYVYTLLFRASDVHAARLLYTAAAPCALALVTPSFLHVVLVILACVSVALL